METARSGVCSHARKARNPEFGAAGLPLIPIVLKPGPLLSRPTLAICRCRAASDLDRSPNPKIVGDPLYRGQVFKTEVARHLQSFREGLQALTVADFQIAAQDHPYRKAPQAWQAFEQEQPAGADAFGEAFQFGAMAQAEFPGGDRSLQRRGSATLPKAEHPGGMQPAKA